MLWPEIMILFIKYFISFTFVNSVELIANARVVFLELFKNTLEENIIGDFLIAWFFLKDH